MTSWAVAEREIEKQSDPKNTRQRHERNGPATLRKIRLEKGKMLT
jgi:hypothetical protein